MKKILAIVIVAVMAVALCVSASANFNIDRLFINLDHMDGESHLADNPVAIQPGDKLYIIGWAFGDANNPDSTLKEIVYTIDDGADVKLPDNYRDRTDVCQVLGVDAALGVHAGFGHDKIEDGGLLELTGIDQLKDGTYKLTLKAIYNAGDPETKELTLKVGTGEKAEDPNPPADDNPPAGDNPPTADASVIAIAAVACIALAGVVVAKKVR